jgi:Alcohol dehydrogenase, class IV
VIKDAAAQQKHVISGESLLPRAVALDPALMTGLPPQVTAATGLDALTHGIEAFLSVWDRGNRTETARLAIQGVFTWLPRAMATPEDVSVRLGMTVAAYYGGVAINQVNVGNIHAIAHQLGARYGIPHGVANALVMPEVLELYGPLVVPQLAELAVVTEVSSATSQEARANAMIAAIRQLREDVGLPATDDRLQSADFDAIAEAALAEGDGYFSPRLLTKEEVLGLLQTIKA